jgi:hypothetical protein
MLSIDPLLGYPLLLISEGCSQAWRGGEDSHNQTTQSHYDLACGIVGLAGLLKLGDQDILVLGDAPTPTYWIPTQRGAVIVRWVAADSEPELLAFGMRLSEGNPLEVIDFFATESKHWLMSAVAPLKENQDALSVALHRGPYRVESFYGEEGTNWAIVHKIVRRE